MQLTYAVMQHVDVVDKDKLHCLWYIMELFDHVKDHYHKYDQDKRFLWKPFNCLSSLVMFPKNENHLIHYPTVYAFCFFNFI